MSAAEEILRTRRKKLLGLRRGLRQGVYGVSYGMSGYGYPLGAITGVQTPTDPPLSGEQFGSGATDGGSTDSGSSGDSGGAV